MASWTLGSDDGAAQLSSPSPRKPEDPLESWQLSPLTPVLSTPPAGGDGGAVERSDEDALVSEISRGAMDLMGQVSSQFESAQAAMWGEDNNGTDGDDDGIEEPDFDFDGIDVSGRVAQFLEAVTPSEKGGKPLDDPRSADAQSLLSMGLSLLSPVQQPEDAEANLPTPPRTPKPTGPTRKVEDFTGHWRIFPGQIKKGDSHLKALGVPFLVRAAICRAETQVNIISTDGNVWLEKIMNSNLPSAFVKTTQYNLDGVQQELTNPMGGVCYMKTVANYEGDQILNVTTIMEHPQKSITQTVVRTLNKDGSEMHVRDEMVLKNGRVLVREADFRRLEEEDDDDEQGGGDDGSAEA